MSWRSDGCADEGDAMSADLSAVEQRAQEDLLVAHGSVCVDKPMVFPL